MKQEIAKIYEVRKGLTEMVDQITEMDRMEVVMELMAFRGYHESDLVEEMFNVVYYEGLFKFEETSEILSQIPGLTVEDLQLYGMVDKNNRYLLSGRYVLPIRDIEGLVTALVGWYPDYKKYITTPTYGFMRDAQFYNAESYKQSMLGEYPKERETDKGTIYLVEGIFDTLSLKALGFPVYGNMGLPLSKVKTEMLSRFEKVIWIPDNDNAGRSVNQYYNATTTKRGKNGVWEFKTPSTFIQLPEGVKDCDDFIHKDARNARKEFKKAQSRSKIYTIG